MWRSQPRARGPHALFHRASRRPREGGVIPILQMRQLRPQRLRHLPDVTADGRADSRPRDGHGLRSSTTGSWDLDLVRCPGGLLPEPSPRGMLGVIPQPLGRGVPPGRQQRGCEARRLLVLPSDRLPLGGWPGRTDGRLSGRVHLLHPSQRAGPGPRHLWSVPRTRGSQHICSHSSIESSRTTSLLGADPELAPETRDKMPVPALRAPTVCSGRTGSPRVLQNKESEEATASEGQLYLGGERVHKRVALVWERRYAPISWSCSGLRNPQTPLRSDCDRYVVRVERSRSFGGSGVWVVLGTPGRDRS